MNNASDRSFEVLRVNQPIGEYYVAILPADLLLELSFSKMLTLFESTEEGKYLMKGAQRPVDNARTKAIGQYLDTIEAVFPSSIIIAANYNEAGELVEDDSVRWRVEFEDGQNVGRLIIPTMERLASIVDGQHRLYGFRHVKNESRRKMALICSVFLDLPNPFQAQIFATINHNQKPVNKSLSYELYGFNIEDENPEEWSPEKVAVFLCRKLNTDPASPLQGRIVVGAQDERVIGGIASAKNSQWMISTATVVEGIIRLISRQPQRDRDTIHLRPSGEGRSRSSVANIPDSSPLRSLYLESNDAVIYAIVVNFFTAANAVLLATEKTGYLTKTVGIQALFEVLLRASGEAYSEKSIGRKRFESLLVKAARIDFRDNFFQASGAGKGRIRTAIELAIGSRAWSSMKEDHIAEYRRLLGAQE